MSLWFWSIFPSYSLTPHSVFLTLMFHTIHFYDLHRPAAHFESIVVNFAQNFAQLQGIHIAIIMIKVNIIFFIKLLKGEAGGRTAITFAFVFFYLDLSRSASCKRAPSENVRKSGQILLPPRSNRVRKDHHLPPSHPARHQNTIKYKIWNTIKYYSSQLWLQVHPMCANYRFWY